MARSMPICAAPLAHGPHHHHAEPGDADEQTEAEVAAQQREERQLGRQRSLTTAGERLRVGAVGDERAGDARRRPASAVGAVGHLHVVAVLHHPRRQEVVDERVRDHPAVADDVAGHDADDLERPDARRWRCCVSVTVSPMTRLACGGPPPWSAEPKSLVDDDQAGVGEHRPEGVGVGARTPGQRSSSFGWPRRQRTARRSPVSADGASPRVASAVVASACARVSGAPPRRTSGWACELLGGHRVALVRLDEEVVAGAAPRR